MIPYGRHSVSVYDAAKVAWQLWRRSLTQGPRIQEFEEDIAKYVGAKYAVAVSSATAGLHLSILALNLPPESEIITSPISFVASGNAILYGGLKPSFVDIEELTVNIDIEKVILRAVSCRNLRAIIPVHFAGLPCDMKRLSSFCQTSGVKIIEDAAHALGASYETGEKVGSCKYSDITVFSLHPVKSMTTGEGGIITTNSNEIYKKLLRLRSHGINKLDDDLKSKLLAYSNGEKNPWYYEMQELGFNYRLTEIQAVLGISQLNKLDRFIERRRKLVLRYLRAFEDHPIVAPAQSVSVLNSANHIFPIRVDFSKLDISRQEFMRLLSEKDIGTQVHYIPIPLHPFYQEMGYNTIDLPNSLKYYFDTLTIPLFPSLTFKQQDYICSEILELVSNHSLSQ